MSKKIWYAYIAAVAVYMLLTFLTPTDPDTLARYEITANQARLLGLTVSIPLIIIWFAAAYGFDKFKRYSQAIQSEPDGQALGHIANGLGILALSMPVTSIVSNIFKYVTHNSDSAQSATTIVSNYLDILFALSAFWLIYKGSRELINLVRRKKDQIRHNNFVFIVIGLLAFAYTYFTFQNPNRRVPSGSIEGAAYYLPDWLILFTIILPYLFVWFIGMQAAANISKYNSSVKGVLYKQVLGFLTKGVIGIIAVSILLQFLTNSASFFRTVSLTPLLGIIYLLIIAMATGYIFVAIGAKKLQKIEEV